MKFPMINFKYTAVIVEDSSLTVYNYAVKDDELLLENKYEVQKDDSFHFRNAILVIATSDVISQEVESETANDALEEAYPAINVSDIYYDYQSLHTAHISVIKKVSLEKILSGIALQDKYFSSIRLGPSVKALSTEIESSTTEELASYAIATLIKKLSFKTNLSDFHIELQQAVFNKRFYEIGKWSAIAIFLIGLSVNFYFHEKYRKELDTAKISAQSFKNIDKKIEAVQESVTASEQLINSNNVNYINILRGINEILLEFEEIRFKKLDYQPLKSGINENQSLRLNKNQIVVEGVTSSKSILDNFIKYLNAHALIDHTSILLIKEASTEVEFKILLDTNELR